MLFINTKQKQLVSWSEGRVLVLFLAFLFLNLAKTSQKTSSKLGSILSRHESVKTVLACDSCRGKNFDTGII